MTYESEHENAMILPIPVNGQGEKSLRFINLEGYESLFDDLNNGFPIRSRFSIGCGSLEISAAKDSALAVQEVGSYVASFVPTLDDFDRLDVRFVLPREVWDKIPRYADFGFVVFQLKEGHRKTHPMAFEFQTRNERQLFFPTVHIHDGEVHDEETFNHLLYLQHAGFDSRVGGYVNADVRDVATDVIRSDKIANEFCSTKDTKGIVSQDLLVHRKIVSGLLENVDYEIEVFGHPNVKTINWRFLKKWLPLAIFAGAALWFFRRRTKVEKHQAAVMNVEEQ
jgi:hypothetical protein